MGLTQIEVINAALDGPKSDFRKLTVTVPLAYYEKLIAESARRKISGERNKLLSSLLREALSEYIEKLPS
jgi:transcriptional regulator of met regulon